MGLYEAWKRIAFDTMGQTVSRIWDIYLPLEKKVYESILREKCTRVEGTVKELAARFNMTTLQVCAFFDGINEAVDGLPDLEDMEEDTAVAFDIEYERLYKQMVEYKAEKLYSLPEWDNVIEPDRQKELYSEQKNSRTVVREAAKVGRNAACPCGSGKKFKQCCGK
ncbi:MAG: SEC-C metal-binding domain-containing protein [Defluviitaleaceae bacterium]|nr:SEC-C metal-binding domain-containing protein [Defluviitaleaceae bacterium]